MNSWIHWDISKIAKQYHITQAYSWFNHTNSLYKLYVDNNTYKADFKQHCKVINSFTMIINELGIAS